jgi:hypothetical protein
LVENLEEKRRSGTSEMNQEPQPAVRQGAKGEGHDGLAAVAITLLAASLVILVITRIV